MSNLDLRLAKLDKFDELDKLGAFQQSTNELHDKFDSLKARQDELVVKLDDLQQRVDDLEKGKGAVGSTDVTDKISKAADLLVSCNFEQRALQVKIYALSEKLSISGLQEKEGEDLKKAVDNLLTMNPPLELSKLKFARRIGRPVPAGTRAAKQKHRDVLVKFDRKETVDSIIMQTKSMDIPGNKLIVESDLSSDPVRRHPSALYKFRQEIMKSYPKLLAKNVWISGGVVFVRFSSEKPPLRLLPSSGFDVLKANIQ